jgi:hypothetical protein
MTPITLEQYRRWNLTATRPYTDDPIGTTTTGRRQTDANNSALHTRHQQPTQPIRRRKEPPCRTPA